MLSTTCQNLEKMLGLAEVELSLQYDGATGIEHRIHERVLPKTMEERHRQ